MNRQTKSDIIELTFKYGYLNASLILIQFIIIWISWDKSHAWVSNAVCAVFIFGMWILSIRIALRTKKIRRQKDAHREEKIEEFERLIREADEKLDAICDEAEREYLARENREAEGI